MVMKIGILASSVTLLAVGLSFFDVIMGLSFMTTAFIALIALMLKFVNRVEDKIIELKDGLHHIENQLADVKARLSRMENR